MVLPKNVWQYVVQIPRLAAARHAVRAPGRHAAQPRRGQGAGRLHHGARARTPRSTCIRIRAKPARSAPRSRRCASSRAADVDVHRARRGDRARVHVAERRKHDAATSARTTARARSSTRKTPDGRTSRYISGFSCEKGTVERVEALRALDSRSARRCKTSSRISSTTRASWRSGTSTRRSRFPPTGTVMDDVEVQRTVLGGVTRASRCGGRSSDRRNAALAAPAALRIGIPRVLNLYSTGAVLAHLLRDAGGQRARTSCSATTTTEEMWPEGGRYGSIDPCYPVEGRPGAHPQPALPQARARSRSTTSSSRASPTCRRSSSTRWTTRCPIVAGAPKVMRAAFTKEIDFFARAGVEYVDAR